MPFEKAPQPRPDKWEITFEDEETISIWKYNKKKFPNGPISVENKFPSGYDKMMKKQAKEAKLAKKQSTLEKAKAAKKGK